MRFVRLLVLALLLAIPLWSPAYSADYLQCPEVWCWELQTQCISEGGNHDYFGFFLQTGQLCVDEIGDFYDLGAVDCCRLPGCTPLIWRQYCKY